MKFKRVLDKKARNLLREITKYGTIIDGFNSIRGIAKNGIENKRLNINEKIEIILNKYYNY